MADNPLVAIGVLCAAILYLAAIPTLVRQSPGRRRAVDRFARRLRLPVPASLRPVIAQRLGTYHLGADIGGALGVVAAALWSLTLGRSVTELSWWVLIVFSSLLLGVAIGAGLAALREARQPRDDTAPRVARPTSPTVADYVAPAERQGARLVAGFPLVLVAVSIGLSAGGGDTAGVTGTAAIVVALSVAALVFGEVGTRRVLAVPQAASSDDELVWSDAVRAHTLRAVITIPIVIGTYANVWMLSTLGLEQVDPRSAIGVTLALAFLAAMVVVLVLAAWSLSGAPQRYFLKRLWPGVAGPQRSTSMEDRP